MNVKKTGADDINIQGFSASGFSNSKATVEGSFREVDETFKYTIKNSDNVQLVFEREVIPSDSGSHYSFGSLSLNTNRGPFTIELEDNFYPNLTTVRDINQRLNDIQLQLNQTKVDLDNKCLRVGDLQYCWGTGLFKTNGNHWGSFTLEFGLPFLTPPHVTNSINATDSESKGPAYSIYSYNISEKHYTGAFTEIEVRPRSTSTVRIDFLAIGKWR